MGAAFAQGEGGEAGGTITSVIRDRHQAKAAYRLLDCDQVTHEAVIGGHCAEVLKATQSPGHYLMIEDTTAISYPGLKESEGLGPIGESYTRGLWAHQTLAVKVDWQTGRQELLGLLGQQVWARPAATEEDAHDARSKDNHHTRHMGQDCESRRWMKVLEQAGGAVPGTTWTYVADRESDIYELFQKSWLNDWSFVIRAAQPRALVTDGEHNNLLLAAQAAPVKGQVHVPLRGAKGQMLVEVRSATLTLRGPSRPGGKLNDHTLNVVHARQLNAPRGQEPACWILLTDLPVRTLEACEQVLAIYRCRWLVEELHKALKTGLKVEASQLSDARRLSALIGILSVVSVFLLQHKLAARTDPQAPLTPEQVDSSMLAVLSQVDPPRGQPTRRWFWIAIAKLGGYQNRPSDDDPGWLTLWRGWQTLMLLTRGYELARGS